MSDMIYPQKGPFEKILECAVILAVSAFLIRYAVCTIKSVWGWLILFAVLAVIGIVGYRLYKHHKDSNF